MTSVFEAENHFYKYCDPTRLSKFLAHAQLYQMSLGLPGAFVEAGVYKGASFCRFRKLGRLLHPDHYRKFIGFDVFGTFPEADYEPDRPAHQALLEAAGNESISKSDLLDLLEEQSLADNVDLIQGDVSESMPEYLKNHEELSVAILNIDVDLYQPTKDALEYFFPRVVRSGIIILDDYEGFPGAKKAADEYLAAHQRPEVIQKFPFALSPCYIIKE